jgi:hypothetical protein
LHYRLAGPLGVRYRHRVNLDIGPALTWQPIATLCGQSFGERAAFVAAFLALSAFFRLDRTAIAASPGNSESSKA